MHTYIQISTKQYPCYEGDIRVDHPEIPEGATWPDFPCPSDYAPVHHVDPPIHDRLLHGAYETAPILVNGKWYMTWAVTELTTQQKLEALQSQITQENTRIKMDMDIAKSVVESTPDSAEKDAWVQFHDAITTYWNTYPRPETKPMMPPPPAGSIPRPSLDVPGGAPNVID
jgi:hypothetical protein